MQSSNVVHVVDPDMTVGEVLVALLAPYSIEVRTHVDAEQFLESDALHGIGHGCVLVDVDLPGKSGLWLLRELRARGSGMPAILMIRVADPDIREQAVQAGATEVLEKSLIHGYLLDRTGQRVSGSNPNQFELPDGTGVTFRIMRPEDTAIEQAFVRGLSKRSRYLRFFSAIKQLSPDMLKTFTEPFYPHSFALIATVFEDGRERQIGVARYARSNAENVAEFAVVVADEWHGLGLATHLLAGITTAAAMAGFKRLEALVLRENEAMCELARTRGFIASSDTGDSGVIRVAKDLGNPPQLICAET